MQDPAELDTENGLIAIGLNEACFGLDLASAPPTSTDLVTDPSLTDPSLGDPVPTDPSLIDPNASGIYNGMPPNLLGLNGLHPNSLT
ncbi:MAG: hypothetical protein ACJ79H_17025, partial [Myxococcales bacterium]